MPREIESFGAAVMDRDDDLPDLNTVIANKGREPKAKAPKPQASPAPQATPEPPVRVEKPKPQTQFNADPPGIVVGEGEQIYNVHFQWCGLEGTYQIPAKTEADAIEILVGHFRKRCKVVVGG